MDIAMEFTFNAFYTLIAAVIVLLLGRLLVNKIDFLKRYNIPEPVAGGLVAAIVSLLVNQFWGYSITIQFYADFLRLDWFKRELHKIASGRNRFNYFLDCNFHIYCGAKLCWY